MNLPELKKFDLSKFRPNRGSQDKRDRDGILNNLGNIVSYGLYKKAIPVLTMAPMVDSKRRYLGNHCNFPPNTPIQKFYEEHKDDMDRAMKETLLLVVQAEAAMNTNKMEQVKEIFGQGEEFEESEDEVEESNGPEITKPHKPVMSMVQEECVKYYPIFLRDLYKIEGNEKPKLWPKRDKEGDLCSSASSLQFYDQYCEDILQRDSYLGRGTPFYGSSLGTKIQVIVAYILHKFFSIDHNLFCNPEPSPSYQPKFLDFDNLDILQWIEEDSKTKKKRLLSTCDDFDVEPASKRRKKSKKEKKKKKKKSKKRKPSSSSSGSESSSSDEHSDNEKKKKKSKKPKRKTSSTSSSSEAFNTSGTDESPPRRKSKPCPPKTPRKEQPPPPPPTAAARPCPKTSGRSLCPPTPGRSLCPPTPVRTPAILLSRFERPNKSFGTPIDIPEEDEDVEEPEVEVVEEPEEENVVAADLIYRDIDTVKPGNVEKSHAGGITTVIVFDVRKVKGSGLYRGSISDGRKFSNKVLFKRDLCGSVVDHLLDRIKIVRLDSVEIIKGAVVGVVSFTVLEDGPRSVGEAVFIGDEYYRKLKPRGIYSPSRLRGKLFN